MILYVLRRTTMKFISTAVISICQLSYWCSDNLKVEKIEIPQEYVVTINKLHGVDEKLATKLRDAKTNKILTLLEEYNTNQRELIQERSDLLSSILSKHPNNKQTIDRIRQLQCKKDTLLKEIVALYLEERQKTKSTKDAIGFNEIKNAILILMEQIDPTSVIQPFYDERAAKDSQLKFCRGILLAAFSWQNDYKNVI